MVQPVRLNVVVKANSASAFWFDSTASTTEASKKNIKTNVSVFVILSITEASTGRIEDGEMW
jgi:hypothetical protein